MTTKSPTKPTLDLDALEAEELAPPYEFTADGRTWVATNPQLLPWTQYDELDPSDTMQILGAMLGDQFADFREIGLSKWKIDRLAQALGEHFDPDKQQG